MQKEAIKVAWAKSVNNKEYRSTKNKEYGNKIEGKLFSVHYMAYNIIRGYSPDRGFNVDSDGWKKATWYLKYFIKYQPAKLLFAFENLITIEEFKELL